MQKLDIMDLVLKFGWIPILIILAALYRVILRVAFGTVIIAKDSIGIVTKKWS
jgi:hypothetical protein